MPRTFRNGALAAALGCAPFVFSIVCDAADFDGSRSLTCATMETQDCGAGVACERNLPQAIGAPEFLRIDFAKGVIAGPKRTTAIASMTKGDEQLLLQGTELGYAWTLALRTDDGALSGSLVNRDGVVALFGACTVGPA